MKDYIKDCLLFQSGDMETNIIGVVTWFCIISFFVILYFTDFSYLSAALPSV